MHIGCARAVARLDSPFPPRRQRGYDPAMSEEWEDVEGPGSMLPYRTVVCSLTIRGEPDPLITIIIAVLAIACAAFCVSLAVRIINRRERWAISIAALIGVVLYAAAMLAMTDRMNEQSIPRPTLVPLPRSQLGPFTE